MLWLHNWKGGGSGDDSRLHRCCSTTAAVATFVLNITTTFHPSPGGKNKTKHVLYVENLVLRGPDGILFFHLLVFIEIWQLN